jgi:hypothetical protein
VVLLSVCVRRGSVERCSADVHSMQLLRISHTGQRLLVRSRRCWARELGTSSGEKDKDYLTNDGVVEGVWIFCRHGDRTPSRPLSPAHRRDEEGAFWMTTLPSPDSACAFEAFSKYFPLETSDNANKGKFIDVGRNPFGFLTQKGLEQLKENGHRFFNRYNHHGHHLPDDKMWRRGVPQDFLSCWDVTVYSTNYLRTVLSVQSFLDGLLGTDCYLPTGTRKFDKAIFKELRVPNHAWKRPDHGEKALVKVQVRQQDKDTLNAFDRNPDLMADMVSEVMLSDDFQKKDTNAAPLAARLANCLPGLVRPRRSDFSLRSPSGINWVEAADHFVCRASHKLAFSGFSDFEHDDRVEQTLAAMSHQTKAHLAWRFRKWYQSNRLLAAIAAPPLREIVEQMKTTPNLGAQEKRPFVIYSCHDITILGLLYGIGADFLVSDWRLFWPGYGTTLAFELVRIEEDSAGAASHLVRILLNGKPVISVDFDKEEGTDAHVGHGPEKMLSVHDFEVLVSRLEEAGGHDYATLLGYK